MQYIQTPDGEERPIRFGFLALKKFGNKTGHNTLSTFAQLDQVKLEHLPYLLFYGFEAGAKRDGIEFDVKPKDVEDWIDDDFSLIEKAMEVLTSDLGVADEGNAETVKGKK
jgi:hypothetical protein